VFCQLDALRQCLPSSLRRTLAELPESLDETYERIVKDIKKGNRADAYRMLQCLAVAIRPLSVAELAELLAFDFDAPDLKGGIPKLNTKWRWEDHEQAVLSTCSSLIIIVPTDDSPIVQFSHFSVKEFLLSDRLATSAKDISRYHIMLEDANTLIAKACLGFLLRDLVEESDARIAPLALYAAEHWVAHAKVENVASRIRNGMEYLFDPDQPYFSAWVRLYNADKRGWHGGLESKIRPEAAPLYHAAFIGFHEIVEHLLLKYPHLVNAISGGAGTALHSASNAGHVEVLRSLVKYGADMEARGADGMSPLQLASFNGDPRVVHCLLDLGADPNFQDDGDCRLPPLSIVAKSGHSETVRVLLERGADANFRDNDGHTLIHNACSDYSGNDSLVRLLLEHGADPNARDNERQTPLHLLALSYLDSSTKLGFAGILLAHGADVDAEDDGGRTPLQVALAKGGTEIAQLLSEYCSKGV
jgi:ankyrin repeat protein